MDDMDVLIGMGINGKMGIDAWGHYSRHWNSEIFDPYHVGGAAALE